MQSNHQSAHAYPAVCVCLLKMLFPAALCWMEHLYMISYKDNRGSKTHLTSAGPCKVYNCELLSNNGGERLNAVYYTHARTQMQTHAHTFNQLWRIGEHYVVRRGKAKRRMEVKTRGGRGSWMNGGASHGEEEE